MTTMKMYQRIINCKNQMKSTRQTAKELGISRKTVSKYYKMDCDSYIKYKMSMDEKIKRFDPYKNEIIRIYQKNDNKVYKSSIYDVLEEKHGKLPGSERTLRNYISFLVLSGQIKENKSFRIYSQVEELPFGKQLQLDFGETRIASGEKVYIFATVLSASRYRYVSVQKRPFRTLDIIQHLLNCFDYIGGIPHEIVIDQDRALVVSENKGDIILTNDFKGFKSEMGFSLFVCRKADPESKGKVENLVKFVKTSFFSGRSFNSFEEIAPRLNSWLERRANGKICQATDMVPHNLLQKEQEKLKTIRPSIYRKDQFLAREDRKVSEKCMISVGGSTYSVPLMFRKQKVWIYRYNNELIIYSSQAGAEIARHKLSLIPGETIIQRNHFRNTSIKPTDLKIELIEKGKHIDHWEHLIEENYRHFKRYFRDQHHVFSSFLEKGYERELLKDSIRFCIDSEKLSANDLREAYSYFEGIKQEQQPNILPTLLTGVNKIKREARNPKVKKRKMSYYTSLVSLLGGSL